MFRSGRLTRTRLNRILTWVVRFPHDMKKVARACQIYPTDLAAWYLYGQDPDCRDPLMAELAWKVAEIRGEAAAKNYARLEALAEDGHFQAIEKLESLSTESMWEISPTNEQAEEISRVFREAQPTPLLIEGLDEGSGNAAVRSPPSQDDELPVP